jgi:hypothetical protein
METALIHVIDALLGAALSPWTWLLVLLYLVFLGNARWRVHGILESLWAGAQAVARIADRLGTMEKKLDTLIELQSKPNEDSDIRLSIRK